MTLQDTGLYEDGECVRRSGRPDIWPAAAGHAFPTPGAGAGLQAIASEKPEPAPVAEEPAATAPTPAPASPPPAAPAASTPDRGDA